MFEGKEKASADRTFADHRRSDGTLFCSKYHPGIRLFQYESRLSVGKFVWRVDYQHLCEPDGRSKRYDDSGAQCFFGEFDSGLTFWAILVV